MKKLYDYFFIFSRSQVICLHKPAIFINLGDFHYDNISVTNKHKYNKNSIYILTILGVYVPPKLLQSQIVLYYLNCKYICKKKRAMTVFEKVQFWNEINILSFILVVVNTIHSSCYLVLLLVTKTSTYHRKSLRIGLNVFCIPSESQLRNAILI